MAKLARGVQPERFYSNRVQMDWALFLIMTIV